MSASQWGATGALMAVIAASAAHAESIVETNVKMIEPGETVDVATIPDGIYLRSTNDPDDIIWERLPEYRMHLMPAPPYHESVALRWNDEAEGQDVFFSLAQTSERFYVRLRWRDETMDQATKSDQFRDGVAVQFALADNETSAIMGTGPEEPVNIWYWRSDANSIENLAAGGPGSTTRLDEQPVSGDSLYMARAEADASEWVVVMSRPLSAESEHNVGFDRPSVPIAFALWQGSDQERDGLKSVSEDWILARLAAE